MKLFKSQQTPTPKTILNYCLAHKPPSIQPPSACTLVELGPKGSIATQGFERTINAYELWETGAKMHPFLGGTLGSFAVLKDLKTRDIPTDALVSIIHYRRVLLPGPRGTLAPNYPDMRLLTPQEASNLSLDTEYARLKAHGLYSKAQRIKGVLRQYEKCHAVTDLLRFVAAAVDANVINGNEVKALLADRQLIPGGVEFGITPVQSYIEIVEKLEATCLGFLKDHRPVDQSPEQMRALNFCSERLGSYLLKQDLAKRFGRRLPRQVFGHMHVVSEGSEYVPGH